MLFLKLTPFIEKMNMIPEFSFFYWKDKLSQKNGILTFISGNKMI